MGKHNKKEKRLEGDWEGHNNNIGYIKNNNQIFNYVIKKWMYNSEFALHF